MAEDLVCLLEDKGQMVGNPKSMVGLEAMEVGATVGLLPDDVISPSSRETTAHIMRGRPLGQVFAQYLVRKRGAKQQPSQVPAVLPDLETQLSIATGLALACKMQKSTSVVMALSGGGAEALKSGDHALRFAGANRLPVIFVVENNSWRESSAAFDDFFIRSREYGFPVITVDGNDAVAVYRVCHEARERARQGYGPTLVECQTYHWYARANGLAQLGEEEIWEWARREPVQAMEHYLRKRNLLNDAQNERIIQDVRTEVDEAVKYAKGAEAGELSFAVRKRKR